MGTEPTDFRATIRADLARAEAIQRISHVDRWWSKNCEGSSSSVGDVFTVRFANGDRYTIRIAELDPTSGITWDVTDSFQGWVADTDEWIGTSIVWAVNDETEGVSIEMTHVGLVPKLECFDGCTGGWRYLVNESLAKYLTDGEGLPV